MVFPDLAQIGRFYARMRQKNGEKRVFFVIFLYFCVKSAHFLSFFGKNSYFLRFL